MRAHEPEWLIGADNPFKDIKSGVRNYGRKNHRVRVLDKPFIFWDGEGINHNGEGNPQSYVLFGSSEGVEIRAWQLSTEQCLEALLESSVEHPDAINAGFAFKYDTEMILADLSITHWRVLRAKGKVRWHGYRIEYFPGKSLQVTHKRFGVRRSIIVYDVWGFFQSSFIKALRAWLNDEELEDIDRIESGKQARGDFKMEELDEMIAPYWRAELRLGVKLMNRLRDLLIYADVCPERWHGPGAIASYVYKRRNIRQYMARLPEYKDDGIGGTLPKPIYDAGRIAYAGGRFELFDFGHHPNQVWQYDINSAYPAAISELPNLATGKWVHRRYPDYDPSKFGMWRIEFNVLAENPAAQRLLIDPQPMPFFRRDKTGRVSFPYIVSSWVWTPEAKFAAQMPRACKITEAWIFEEDGERPFAFVNDVYSQRQEWKIEGNPAEKALKLLLNSLYGKTAQRAGWAEQQRLPKFYQLEWAGYVTSRTRQKLYDAMILAGLENVIACETDAIFTRKPVPGLPISSNLGEWSETKHEWVTYLQSGMYWTDTQEKYRGLDKPTKENASTALTHDRAMEWLENSPWGEPITAYTTRFIGSGRGLGKPYHRAWLKESREIIPGLSGKRVHIPGTCPQCRQDLSPHEALHTLTIGDVEGGYSVPHRLPWEETKFREFIAAEKFDAVE